MLRNIQHTGGNRPLKGAALGSADKYITLLLLARPNKPIFDLQIFSYNFLLNSHWLLTFFELKKLGSNPIFYCFRTKKVASYEKIRKWKTSFKISMSIRNLQILSKNPLHPAFNFEAVK